MINMKHLWKLLIVIMVFALMGSSQAVHLGNRTYGYVEKDYYGDLNSTETIAVIIGVHPQESGIHSAVREKIQTSNLTKRYVLYSVHVTQDAQDYSRGRMNGQLLARDFVVPDIKNEKPMLVIDCHENHYHDSGYAYPRFLDIISENTATINYTDQIIARMNFLKIYRPPKPTSPQYVTIPIASQGYNTVIYETYFYDTYSRKLSDAGLLVKALDSLQRYTATGPSVTSSNPRWGGMTTRRPLIRVTFSGRITPGRYWNSIALRNQFGKTVRIKKWVSGNTLNVKPLSRLSGNRWYTLVVPAAALVDSPQKRWTLKFRTGRR